MNVGDKVRFLKGQEEGIITRFLEGDLVEVEIEDGFQVPMVRNELVLIAKEEDQYFSNKAVPESRSVKPNKPVLSYSGVFLAFQSINDQQLSLYLINNTDLTLPFNAVEVIGKDWKGLKGGALEPKKAQKLGQYSLQNFDHWSPILIQLLFPRTGILPPRNPLERKIQFKASTFFKNKKKAPVLDTDAYLFQIDDFVTENPVSAEEIKEGLLSEKSKDIQVSSAIPIKAASIDLHIEELIKDHSGMSNAEIIQLQLEVFEKELDQAFVKNIDEITFVHGVGNGVLRNQIHKRLSQRKDISYFKDSQKEKFGYGATLVRLK